jgi:hypothetical protein
VANHLALHSFCQSLADFLAQSYATFVPDPGMPALPAAKFDVLSSAKFTSSDVIPDKTVTLFLHRVTTNNHLRNTRTGPAMGPLGLDLHLLLTVWADDAMDEHSIFGWVLRTMHFHPFLDRSSLNDDAAWAVDEQINIVPAELSPEELARIWEAAQRGYRLSYPFIARVVRIGLSKSADGAPVVATRFTYTDDLNETTP